MREGEERKSLVERFRLKDKKRFALAVSCSVLLLFVIIFGGLAVRVSAYNKIFPNITAGGVDIGALSKEDAAERLKNDFEKALNEKEFTLTLEDKDIKFTAADIEAAADIEKTVENAYNYGNKGNIFKRVGRYLIRREHETGLVSKINEEKTEALVLKIAEGSEVPVKETGYTLSGDIITIVNGHGGRKVDREKAAEKIKAEVFSLTDKAISLKLEEAAPQKVNVEEFYKKITEGEKNAYYARENGNIVVKDGFPKIEMDKKELEAALESGKDTYEIKVTVTPPKVTAEKLRAMLFRDKMGSWTSNFSGGNVPRSSNVRLSASRINGVTLLPGEIFSYDSTIGRRTKENGYKTAAVYVGNKVDEGIGGGICQTSSTLYSAVLYANLEIVSRTSHSLPVSYMPAGQDATIAEGYIDFKFKNNTDYPIKILAETSYGSVTCTIMGVKPEGESVKIINTKTSTLQPKITRTTNPDIPAGYKIVSQKGAEGYTVSSQRVVSVNGVEQKRENLTKSVYKALDTIEEVNPADKNTPSESLKLYDKNTYNKEKTEQTAASAEPAPAEKPAENTGENKDGAEDKTPNENIGAEGAAESTDQTPE